MHSFQVLLDENNAIRNRIHPVFLPLMAPHIKKVDIALQPGLIMLCWTSLNLEAFFKTVKASLRDLELLVKEVIYVLSLLTIMCTSNLKAVTYFKMDCNSQQLFMVRI